MRIPNAGLCYKPVPIRRSRQTGLPVTSIDLIRLCLTHAIDYVYPSCKIRQLRLNAICRGTVLRLFATALLAQMTAMHFDVPRVNHKALPTKVTCVRQNAQLFYYQNVF